MQVLKETILNIVVGVLLAIVIASGLVVSLTLAFSGEDSSEVVTFDAFQSKVREEISVQSAFHPRSPFKIHGYRQPFKNTP